MAYFRIEIFHPNELNLSEQCIIDAPDEHVAEEVAKRWAMTQATEWSYRVLDLAVGYYEDEPA